MINPFAILGFKDKENPEGELVEGQFSCQEDDCVRVAKEATYFENAAVLKWVCPDGHPCKIEDFII